MGNGHCRQSHCDSSGSGCLSQAILVIIAFVACWLTNKQWKLVLFGIIRKLSKSINLPLSVYQPQIYFYVVYIEMLLQCLSNFVDSIRLVTKDQQTIACPSLVLDRGTSVKQFKSMRTYVIVLRVKTIILLLKWYSWFKTTYRSLKREKILRVSALAAL